MSLSHPLHQRLPAVVQKMDRCKQIWLKIRQKINDLRTKELPNVMRGDTSSDDRLRDAMNRLYEVRESMPLFTPDYKLLPALQRSAMLAATDTHLAVVEDTGTGTGSGSNIASSFNLFVDIPLLPPGVDNIRFSPRRPGAPSAVPFLH